MPYITFSRNVKNPRVAKKIIEKNKVSNGSVVVLRGKKSIDDVVNEASAKGQSVVLIVDNSGGATEIVLDKLNPGNWSYGKRAVIR